MISIYKNEDAKLIDNDEVRGLEFRGLSTDVKPTVIEDDKDINNGSMFIEIDTGKVFLYDLENKQWKEI